MKLGTPARGLAFIKHILTEDRYPGSRIVLTDQSRDAIARQQFQVMAVGEAELCEDEDCERSHWASHLMSTDLSDDRRWHRCDVRVGDWILARNRSWQATPDPSVYVIRVDDILGKFVETQT